MTALELALAAVGRGLVVAGRPLDGGGVETATAARADELLLAVDDVVSRLGGAPADVRRLVVDRGPGSYTGVRTVMTFARALASRASSGPDAVEVRAFTSFERIAWCALRGGQPLPVRVVLDARRARVHTARVTADDPAGPVRLADRPEAVEAHRLAERRRPDETVLLSGDDPPPPAQFLEVVARGRHAARPAAEERPAVEGSAADRVATAPATSGTALLEPGLSAALLSLERPSEWLPLYLMGTYAD